MLLIVGGLFAWGYAQGLADPVVHRTVLPMRGLSGPVRIALVSDSHMSYPDMPPERLAHIVQIVNAEKPDLILLAGDYIGEDKLFTRAPTEAEAVAPLSGLRAPLGVYAVLGNHDNVTMRVARHVIKALESSGIHVLENEIADVSGLMVGGASPYSRRARGGSVGGLIDRFDKVQAPRILLTHSPDLLTRLKQKPELLLTGHTHCGQVRLFGRPVASATHIAPQLYCGRYQLGPNAVLIASGGLGTSRLPIRFFTPPDFWMITLVPARS